MSYKINYSTEEKIKLAKDDSVEKMYERRAKRTMRVLTVTAYIFSVSLAAIILSAYYVFIWKPNTPPKVSETLGPKCEKIIIPENIAIKLANSSEVSVDTFFSDFIKQLTKLKPSNQEDFIKLNRSGFNNYLEFISNQLQSDEPKKKNHRKVKKDKKYQDDEDFNLDLESSGDKMSVVTAPTTDPSSDLNDTTIIFDQEQE